MAPPPPSSSPTFPRLLSLSPLPLLPIHQLRRSFLLLTVVLLHFVIVSLCLLSCVDSRFSIASIFSLHRSEFCIVCVSASSPCHEEDGGYGCSTRSSVEDTEENSSQEQKEYPKRVCWQQQQLSAVDVIRDHIVENHSSHSNSSVGSSNICGSSMGSSSDSSNIGSSSMGSSSIGGSSIGSSSIGISSIDSIGGDSSDVSTVVGYIVGGQRAADSDSQPVNVDQSILSLSPSSSIYSSLYPVSLYNSNSIRRGRFLLNEEKGFSLSDVIVKFIEPTVGAIDVQPLGDRLVVHADVASFVIAGDKLYWCTYNTYVDTLHYTIFTGREADDEQVGMKKDYTNDKQENTEIPSRNRRRDVDTAKDKRQCAEEDGEGERQSHDTMERDSQQGELTEGGRQKEVRKQDEGQKEEWTLGWSEDQNKEEREEEREEESEKESEEESEEESKGKLSMIIGWLTYHIPKSKCRRAADRFQRFVGLKTRLTKDEAERQEMRFKGMEEKEIKQKKKREKKSRTQENKQSIIPELTMTKQEMQIILERLEVSTNDEWNLGIATKENDYVTLDDEAEDTVAGIKETEDTEGIAGIEEIGAIEGLGGLEPFHSIEHLQNNPTELIEETYTDLSNRVCCTGSTLRAPQQYIKGLDKLLDPQFSQTITLETVGGRSMPFNKKISVPISYFDLIFATANMLPTFPQLIRHQGIDHPFTDNRLYHHTFYQLAEAFCSTWKISRVVVDGGKEQWDMVEQRQVAILLGELIRYVLLGFGRADEGQLKKGYGGTTFMSFVNTRRNESTAIAAYRRMTYSNNNNDKDNRDMMDVPDNHNTADNSSDHEQFIKDKAVDVLSLDVMDDDRDDEISVTSETDDNEYSLWGNWWRPKNNTNNNDKKTTGASAPAESRTPQQHQSDTMITQDTDIHVNQDLMSKQVDDDFATPPDGVNVTAKLREGGVDRSDERKTSESLTEVVPSTYFKTVIKEAAKAELQAEADINEPAVLLKVQSILTWDDDVIGKASIAIQSELAANTSGSPIIVYLRGEDRPNEVLVLGRPPTNSYGNANSVCVFLAYVLRWLKHPHMSMLCTYTHIVYVVYIHPHSICCVHTPT
eukprot:GHVQ01009043.1.p1 GENE.GHVQ01009043.1~~GHVQ01009043.1.p1  ORF type:complete len:1093 (-),score=238.80 GHVQ01009043.1:44-3322(-)